jgi:hypothetical protein
VNIEQEALKFADELGDVLSRVLPGDFPPPQVLLLEDRFVIHPGKDTRPTPVPMYAQGEQLASLKVSYSWCADKNNQYLAVEKSLLELFGVTRAPLLRYDYVRYSHSAPTAHWQIHAERGAFSRLLAHAGHPTAHELSSLHIPVGGSRFRPCIEDFLQFAIQECRLDAKPGWEMVLADGRERWRLRQCGAVARDAPAVAARVLTDLGYTVTPPASGHRGNTAKALRNW